MTITYALKSEDSLEFSFTAKDSQGNLYYDLKGTGKRVEPRADAADSAGGPSSWKRLLTVCSERKPQCIGEHGA